MKKYIITTGKPLFIIFLFFSCNDQFLERYPLDRISNETFWSSENDLMVYNNSLYDLARHDGNVPIMMGHDEGWFSVYYSIWYPDLYSDNLATKGGYDDNYADVKTGKHVVPTGPQFYGYSGWEFVRAINVGLANYNKAKVAQSVIDKYAGEARLFRGWFYADKVSKFGDVIWLEKELTTESEELYAARTSREDVMTKVLEDLNFAVSNLPADWGDGSAPGRLNRWCALQVKSRVCLFEGTWRKYHGGSDPDMWLREAANAAKELIESGPYSLYVTGDPDHDYNAIHRATDLTGNPEVLYWRKYKEGVVSHNAMWMFHRWFSSATKSMVEDYLCTDGLPITLSTLYKGDAVYEDIFENRDPRLRQTILHPNDKKFYNYVSYASYSYPRVSGMSGGLTTETGYHVIKNFESVGYFVNWDKCVSPAITLRLGEALLNYAEALAELGTITQADLDISINKLRDRVGMPHMDLSSLPVDPRYADDGISPIIAEIRRERRVELFAEGFRYDDLRRWKQGKKLAAPSLGMRWDDANRMRFDPEGRAGVQTATVSGVKYIDVYQGTDWANPVFNEGKHYLWPIHLNALSQNPNIGQNPGW